MKLRVALCFFAVLVAGCMSKEQGERKNAVAEETAYADSVYINARIYTVNDENPWASAMAVRDGKLFAVGTDAEIVTLVGTGTMTHDLDGKMVMPGIHDTHIHPADAGIQKQQECSFLSNDLDEVLKILQDCLAEIPAGEWLRGGQWNEGLFSSGKAPKTILDEVAPDHPVFLMDWSVHNAWVNSKALQALGIDGDTPDPAGGVIVRDPVSGEATGILLDNAAYDMRRELPAYSLEQTVGALSWSIGQIAQYGVTTFKDAIVTTNTMKAYDSLSKSGDLPLRVKTNLTWKSAWADSHGDEQELIAQRKNYSSDRIDTSFAKIMLDGIPPTYTAVLLEPYEPSERFGSNHNGELMLSPAELIADVVELDRQGLTVKIHATGDGSARAALDAFEAARKENGDSGLIHEVSHAEMIHPDDMPRFRELNVAAEMCPIIWYPIAGLDWEMLLGKDRVPVWPIRSLVEAGALVIYGSDWPVVPTPNPWPGIEAMVTRSDPYDQAPGAEYPSEAIDLPTAVGIFTINSAIANKVGESSGSIEAGKDADFIVLDRNIFEVPIETVGETQVLLTVVAGERVHDRL